MSVESQFTRTRFFFFNFLLACSILCTCIRSTDLVFTLSSLQLSDRCSWQKRWSGPENRHDTPCTCNADIFHWQCFSSLIIIMYVNYNVELCFPAANATSINFVRILLQAHAKHFSFNLVNGRNWHQRNFARDKYSLDRMSRWAEQWNHQWTVFSFTLYTFSIALNNIINAEDDHLIN